MKKMSLLIIAGMLAISICACGQTPNSNTEGKNIMPDDIATITDSTGETIPDPDALAKPDFGSIASSSVFNVNWKTSVDGDVMSGTASLLKTDLSDEPILITAYHIFDSETVDLTPDTLKDYIKGGELIDIMSPEDSASIIGNVKETITIPDAEGVDTAQSPIKDLAAFKLDNSSALKAFPLAKEPCVEGEVVYLLASLWDTAKAYENNIYPCVVLSDNGEQMTYLLSDQFGTTGASGAPIVNSKGELVGIHIGSNNSYRFAHSALGIYEQLKSALGK
nr:serine protease [uncultured Aminipila sp.]